MAGIVGFGAAIVETAQLREAELVRLKKLQTVFVQALSAQISGITFNGSSNHRLPNNVHITIDGIDNETLIMQLDEAGIMAATGSACSASSDEPSHVLRVIGMTDAQARSSIRFTMGRNTTQKDIDYVLLVLTQLLNS